MDNLEKELQASLNKGFINKDFSTSEILDAKFLINEETEKRFVLDTLQSELEKCENFFFSVAFITESGLSSIKSILADLDRKNIKGRIITSNYLFFNQPKIFRELLRLKNVEVRIIEQKNFHAKGYMFQQNNYYTLIIGSSNLTMNALKIKHEWNIKLNSLEHGEILQSIQLEYETLWANATELTENWIGKYENEYRKQKDETKSVEEKFEIENLNESDEDTYQVTKIITPNKMQKRALRGIEKVRDKGERKALVVSATGTGKTYLAAFDVKKSRPKKMLFIVHREQILNKAMSDFIQILKEPESCFGKITGRFNEREKKYVFATIQSISKDDKLLQFAKDEFEYILVDEVHKAGAPSYVKVLEYFTPEFLLGMTATPERTDNFNIFELFDYNVAYEIRLQEAMEENMLCPFHYFGVTDYEKDGQVIDDLTELSTLTSNERLDFLLEKIKYYGHYGDQVHGLIFCSRQEEVIQFSKEMNKRGYRTKYLLGKHDMNEREVTIQELERGEIDYIITVDIFNEGIDIPCVNQVVMVRQTESSIIFIQQLGRGLRKNEGKEYVTIIDFIGNYKKNYLIPVALTGDNSMNKNRLKEQMINKNFLAGVSLINFEEIARERIYQTIATTNITTMAILKDGYLNLKNKVNRIPKLHDFIDWNSIDPFVVANAKGNYLRFIEKVERTENFILSQKEEQVIHFVTKELLNGKRPHELLLLKSLLLEEKTLDYVKYENLLRENNIYLDEQILTSIVHILNLTFFSKADRKKYGENAIVIFNTQTFSFSDTVSEMLKSKVFKEHFQDLIETGLTKSKQYDYSKRLTISKEYTRKDVCRLLGWEKDVSSTVYGYAVRNKQCPIFVTYHKNEEIDSTVAYGDKFISVDTMKWFTRSNRRLNSNEIQPIIHAETEGTEIHIFVKKDDDEGSDFYYLGRAAPVKDTVKETTMPTNKPTQHTVPVVSMNMRLEQPVQEDLYRYLSYKNTAKPE